MSGRARSSRAAAWGPGASINAGRPRYVRRAPRTGLSLAALALASCTGRPAEEPELLQERLDQLDQQLAALDDRLEAIDAKLEPTVDWAKQEMEHAQAVKERVAERKIERDARRAEREARRADARSQLPEPLRAAPTGTDSAAAAEALASAETAIRCPSTEPPRWTCSVDRAFVDALLAAPASAMKQARVVPKMTDGEMIGLKLYGIRPRSVPKLLGLKNGDSVLSIGGAPLDGMDAMLEAFNGLRGAERVELALERKGERLALHVEFAR